jgi:hypothetical protein
MKVPCVSLLTLASATILFVGCTKEKSKDIIVNPIDSSSTAFIPAVTTLINPPPADIEIPTSTVTVRWQGTRDVFGIRYKLDDEEWTDLITQNEITVSDLDEGMHSVTVQAQHKNGSLELQPPTFTFIVNAVQGQSVMFLKRKKNVTRNTDFQYFVKAEEVDSLMGFSGVINYNPSRIRVNSVGVGNLKKHSAIDLQQYTSIDNGNGKIRLDLAILGGSPVKGLSGTDTLFILHCTALNTAGETLFTFLRDSTRYRNTNNLNIPIRFYVDGKVVVK